MSQASAAGSVSIDVLEYENNVLRVDGSIDPSLLVQGRVRARLTGCRDGDFTGGAGDGAETERFTGGVGDRAETAHFTGGAGDGVQAVDFTGGTEVALRFTKRYAQVTVDKETFTGRCAFVAELPTDMLQADQCLEFIFSEYSFSEKGAEQRPEVLPSELGAGQQAEIFCRRSDEVCKLPILATNYQARLHSSLREGWWGFEASGIPYIVTLRSDGIRIRRGGRCVRMMQELRFLREILFAKNGSRQMFLMRCHYWLVYLFYRKKRIWITFDKLYKGGDCGEYFYKYMCSRKDDGIDAVYVIRGDVADYGRLKKEGYEPQIYRSRKQRLSYLFAEMVFATHSGVNSFCGFNNWEIRFVQDRLRAVNTCIQHGLSVQDLSADSNRCANNNKRYYCASRCEVENLRQPAYDYNPETLRLTGIPRYDGLVNDDRRQILITPTWRSYLAQHSVMGEARGYNTEFRNTSYFRIFQTLLEHERLLQTAQQCGYRIIYLLHPVVSAQKKDFRQPQGVSICSALETDYEEILTQSSLMVTDYSGVQFDFAYMRKPVVYFHPKELPPHYGDGGFSYEEQGFGEICTDINALVELLCDYMKNGCALKEMYRCRQDEFFAYDDHESCRRIYEDALVYQKEHMTV